MNSIVFAMPGNELLAHNITAALKCEKGEFIIRNFPDEETYVRVLSDLTHKHAIVICSLHHPDSKILPLLFLCRLLKDMNAESVCLVSPYLSYMRQDIQFNPGEAVTSHYFSGLLSSYIDQLVTVDPHLHRTSSLNDIYPVSCTVLHSGKLIAEWVKKNIKQPLFIGPDSESRQWVSEVASTINAPYLILLKDRKGDRDVQVSVPEIKKYKNFTPIIIDDIISTAKTMLVTIEHLKLQNTITPVCIGVHAVFANNAFEELKRSGVEQLITCNTITHETNSIDVSGIIAEALTGFEANHQGT